MTSTKQSNAAALKHKDWIISGLCASAVGYFWACASLGVPLRRALLIFGVVASAGSLIVAIPAFREFKQMEESDV